MKQVPLLGKMYDVLGTCILHKRTYYIIEYNYHYTLYDPILEFIKNGDYIKSKHTSKEYKLFGLLIHGHHGKLIIFKDKEIKQHVVLHLGDDFIETITMDEKCYNKYLRIKTISEILE